MRSVMCAAVLVAIVSTNALALGRDGHEAVCYIAYAQASSQTREKIDTLIAADPTYSKIEDPAEAFASSCVWADKVKRKDGRSKEHYVNVPRNTKKIKSLDCPEADKCLLSAIVSDAAILRDAEASDEDKLNALKYMGHWIGDLHQPLHVSFKDDRGGNDIKVKGIKGCKDLHAVWDTCILRHFMNRHQVKTTREGAEYNWLVPPVSESRTTYEGPVSILDWANNTYRVTTAGHVFYVRQTNRNTVDPEAETEWESKMWTAYLNINGPVQRSLMVHAGHRLANLIEIELILSQ